MFTGLVEEIGTVRHGGPCGDGFELRIACREVLGGCRLGDSIAVNGACLTVTALDDEGFTVGLAPETLSRTALGDLDTGARVNLERALPADGRLGGHIVQGHVDTTGRVVGTREDADARWLDIELEPHWMRYVVPKGYIAIDGTSLTVVEAGDTRFSVTLIAHTQAHVTLPERAVGDSVNIEVDVLGKYVERLLANRDTTPSADDTNARDERPASVLARQTLDTTSDA